MASRTVATRESVEELKLTLSGGGYARQSNNLVTVIQCHLT